MGGYLLCGKTALHPYRAEELGICIYSPEELSYYIYHNAPMIGEDFFGEALFRFLSEELAERELAEKIQKLAEHKAELKVTLTALLRELHYYSEPEILKFQAEMELMGKQTPAERQCRRAEFLLEKQKVQGALKIFRGILEKQKSSGRFSGLLRQRAAVCHVRQMEYGEALEELCAAYRDWPDERILKQIYQLSLLCGKKAPEEIWTGTGAEKLYQWKQEYEQCRDLAETAVRSSALAAIFEKDSLRREEAVREYLEKRKDSYRKSMTA